jgi:ppGpp synthetase/RelA/SpoT-type nucleotidyltranferase
MNINEYLKFRKPYERALRQLLLELDFFIEDVKGINIYSIESRLKEYKSALVKSQKSENLSIHDMQDIAGIRVVVATFEEVEVLVRFFSRKDKEYSDELEIELNEPIERKNGYRARHIVVKFKGKYSRSASPTRIEIQLQTILQHAYNFISRAWVYKSEHPFSKNWKKNFHEISQTLAQLDKKISELQEQVLATSAEGDNDQLTPFSYQRIVSDILGEDVDLDDAVDSTRMLVDMGCDRNKQLKLHLNNSKISDLYNRFLNMKSHKSDQMKAVASLFSNMSRHSFFIMYGTRLDGIAKILDQLESSLDLKQLSDSETDESHNDNKTK